MTAHRLFSTEQESKVKAAANELLARAQIYEAPVDLQKLAAVQGITAIVPRELRGPDAELVRTKDGMLIHVDSGAAHHRRRFSIAHEIAHTFFPPRGRAFRQTDSVVASKKTLGYRTEEKLCDVAAAELLMPKEMFLRELGPADPSLMEICRLAETFDASVLAAASRYAQLCGRAVQINRWTTAEANLRPWPKLGRSLLAVDSFELENPGDHLSRTVAQAYHSDRVFTRCWLTTSSYPPYRLLVEARRFGRGANRYVLSLLRSSKFV